MSNYWREEERKRRDAGETRIDLRRAKMNAKYLNVSFLVYENNNG